MTREDLFRQIVIALENENLLNENDFHSRDNMIKTATTVISQSLDDYVFIQGTVVQ